MELENKKPSLDEPVICSDFGGLSGTPRQQGEWLQARPHLSGNQYDECRTGRHKIDINEYNIYIIAHWGSLADAKHTPIRLGDILDIVTNSYENFVEFKEDASTKKISFRRVTVFTTSPTCYSAPFFYTLERLSAYDRNTIITFTKAKIDKDTPIIFMAGNDSYYDFSHIPPLIDERIAI